MRHIEASVKDGQISCVSDNDNVHLAERSDVRREWIECDEMSETCTSQLDRPIYSCLNPIITINP
jgi:hypothetical protein